MGSFNDRPSWDEYFMEISELVKTRSTCLKRQVGAVIVRDNRILTTGYNGSPVSSLHCEYLGGCMRESAPSGRQYELCRSIHAEQNAIIQAAYSGVSVKDATMYTTYPPCLICAKIIINSGIKRIVYKCKHFDISVLTLLKDSGIECEELT